ncbi:Hypothetical protein R9X50_00205200 [Acrodontium crateriforme]|uniref:GPR1/FUN34/YaaH-class plasma membrane protein n=1 Tax=Acrodontium crateriforme TaxID=150365 RepID=A0AAQ3M1K6_9PEZI|nr:Hypothetical protein R9X50_00205200 [Acrodontium crateriforme]
MTSEHVHLEKGQSNGFANDDGIHITRTETAGSLNLSMEMFEKLYLAPANRVHGDLRKTFANPTPLPILGFLLATSPLTAALMGWGGAGGGGAATIGTYLFFGGLLQIIGAVMEWIIGNTFPFVVFGSFGAFWLAFAATLTPFYNAEGAFIASATSAAETAAGVEEFQASLSFFLFYMGLLVFMYVICSLRTNLIFVFMFFFLDVGVFLLAGGYIKASKGDLETYEKLSKAAGAMIFVTCVCGWYLLFAQLLQSVDFPLDLPVFDLSKKFKGASERKKKN